MSSFSPLVLKEVARTDWVVCVASPLTPPSPARGEGVMASRRPPQGERELTAARKHRAPGPRARPIRTLLSKVFTAWLIVVRPAHDIEQLMDAARITLLRPIDRFLREVIT